VESKILVFQGDAAIRVDQYISETHPFSRAQIQKWIKSGEMTVNNNGVRPAYILQRGDQIAVPQQISEVKKVLAPTFNIVFEDEHLIVVNKPLGLVVHAAHATKAETLVDQLKEKGVALSKGTSSDRDGIVHRLDRDTEGLMVVAKTAIAYESLVGQFKARTVQKKYYAIVYGAVPTDEFNITQPIVRNPKHRHKMQVANRFGLPGKEACTMGKVIQRFTTKTWVQLEPKTGRTHQLRVHMAFLGYPLVGDSVYSKNGKKALKDGQLLQAFFLAFDHPGTGERQTFEIPLSERLKIKVS